MTGSAYSDGPVTPAAPAEQPATAEQPARPVAGPSQRHNRVFVALGLLVAFVLAGFVSGYAFSSPDGLEKVAQDEGFLESAEDHSFADWPLADYAVSGIDNERLAGGLAGVIGVSIVFTVGGAVVLGITRLRPKSGSA